MHVVDTTNAILQPSFNRLTLHNPHKGTLMRSWNLLITLLFGHLSEIQPSAKAKIG